MANGKELVGKVNIYRRREEEWVRQHAGTALGQRGENRKPSSGTSHPFRGSPPRGGVESGLLQWIWAAPGSLHLC